MAGKNRHFGDAETLTITLGRVRLGNESGITKDKLDPIQGHRNDETIGTAPVGYSLLHGNTVWGLPETADLTAFWMAIHPDADAAVSLTDSDE
jgi:hypothetical protein